MKPDFAFSDSKPLFKVRSSILSMLQTILAQAQTAAPQGVPGGGIGSFLCL